MNILPEQVKSSDVEGAQSRITSTAKPAAAKPNDGKTDAAKPAASIIAVTPESAVSLQKDASGRFYYLVTNAQTGQPILEFPPEAVRNVGAGIAEYVQQHTRLNKLEAKG
jgi:hypothetical protein